MVTHVGRGKGGALLRKVEGPGGGAVRPSEHADVGRPEDRRPAGDLSCVGGPWAKPWPDGTTFRAFADGGPDHDILLGPPDVEREWRLDRADRGTLNGNIRLVSLEYLVGGELGDTFVFLPGSFVTGQIDDGWGHDTLDYRPRGSSLGAGPWLAVNIERLLY